MTQTEIILEIKRLKWELSHRFDDTKLIELYRMIDKLNPSESKGVQ